mgnify:CR=1 FL=1
MKRMSPEAWEKLRKENPATWLRLYREFMDNPDNSHDCERCPENQEMGDQWNKFPCDQYHCWVDIHNRKE